MASKSTSTTTAWYQPFGFGRYSSVITFLTRVAKLWSFSQRSQRSGDWSS